jgi:LytTr DNA-binding domain
MFKILSQPYPFSEKSIQQIAQQSILEGLFVAFFLIILEPFGIGNSTIENKYFTLIPYGIVTSIAVFLLRLFVFVKYSKYQDQSDWTIAKEIVSILMLILLITIGNYLLTLFLYELKFSLSGILNMLFMVVIIGIFPTGFGVMTNYIYQFRKYNKTIEIEPTTTKTNLTSTDLTIKLIAENGKDYIEIQPENLLLIESTDNYATIYYLKNQILQKELIRSSLTRLESQINSNKVVRSHRSFIVNLDKIQKITGNAQGYKLQLNFQNLIVPVARKYSFLVDNLK